MESYWLMMSYFTWLEGRRYEILRRGAISDMGILMHKYMEPGSLLGKNYTLTFEKDGIQYNYKPEFGDFYREKVGET
jgi:hypothetical protein